MTDINCLRNQSSYYQYKNAIERGSFYYPAWKHYGSVEFNVVCNKCNKNNLISCIGYGPDVDLCLSCVQTITEILYENPHIPHIHPMPVPPYTEVARTHFPRDRELIRNESHKSKEKCGCSQCSQSQCSDYPQDDDTYTEYTFRK